MANFVVCMDTDHAKIFELQAAEIDETTMKRHEIRHHGADDRAKSNNADKFYHDLASHLTAADGVLLIGPGLAKIHFNDHLTKHHHETIAKKIVAVETVDHPTDGQVIAMAKKFFVAHPSAH